MKRVTGIMLLLAAVWLSCVRQGSYNGQEYLNAGKPLLDIIDSLGIDAAAVTFHVDKSDYLFSVLAGDVVIKTFPVVMGFNPVDDKMREGDGCTPEGTFEIIDLYPHAKWGKFLWIGYPNEESWRKYEANKAAGKIGPNDGIGGEVGIHGVPEGKDYLVETGQNWTLGCISLTNKDVDDLYTAARVGTKVVIVP